MKTIEIEEWDEIIEPQGSMFSLRLREVWAYRDLLSLFVMRDFKAFYAQTIFGPLWFFAQPAFTTFIYTVIFSNVAKLSTDGLPAPLFYLLGIIGWNYFSSCLNRVGITFRSNQHIFGKVYFPRLIVPLSVVFSDLLRLLLQLFLFLIVYLWYFLQGSAQAVSPNWAILLFPLCIILLAGLSLGFGMLITSLTTKYRDMQMLLQFGVQLLMYVTPVIYPLSLMPERWKWAIVMNPLTGILETLRYGFLGVGSFSYYYLSYSIFFTIVIFLFGTVIFNKTEKNFMDTV
ncbi:MAG: ABC transporter permease [Candidatus Wallbacteria bacterium HGW-Wallbacteria-1]|jgi:lipopolysaccharide transport system permease protein|uniref:Transport permease protein n=1 Tax=Candidatus Wallbacteria bacterium HGW-Wallbacteria-1 TaxID=2013854 RepID=A0A2N1PN26_9BACT|nr:MAG: ABC transporter permease [Candidatus Wallbacteria bacterium HGW-Wallbacteria-1]